jgi:hypothetical protein
MYLDLNQIRAGMTDRPEHSKYTSAYDRICGMAARRKKRRGGDPAENLPDRFLAPLHVNGDYPNEDFAEANLRASNKGLFEMTLEIYLNLLDTVGRMIRTGKRGAIPGNLASIVERIGLRSERLADCVETYGKWARQMVGAENNMRQLAEKTKRKWLQGIGKAGQFFTSTPASAVS